MPFSSTETKAWNAKAAGLISERSGLRAHGLRKMVKILCINAMLCALVHIQPSDCETHCQCVISWPSNRSSGRQMSGAVVKFHLKSPPGPSGSHSLWTRDCSYSQYQLEEPRKRQMWLNIQLLIISVLHSYGPTSLVSVSLYSSGISTLTYIYVHIQTHTYIQTVNKK